MKKVVLFIAVMLIAGVSFGQRSYDVVTATTDTVTDTGTKYATLPALTKDYTYSFFAVADKLTGTVSGSVKMEISPDGTNWITHPTADTLTYTNVSDGIPASGVWSGTDFAYPYVRFNVTGTGTSTSIWTIKAILKK